MLVEAEALVAPEEAEAPAVVVAGLVAREAIEEVTSVGRAASATALAMAVEEVATVQEAATAPVAAEVVADAAREAAVEVSAAWGRCCSDRSRCSGSCAPRSSRGRTMGHPGCTTAHTTGR